MVQSFPRPIQGLSLEKGPSIVKSSFSGKKWQETRLYVSPQRKRVGQELEPWDLETLKWNT